METKFLKNRKWRSKLWIYLNKSKDQKWHYNSSQKKVLTGYREIDWKLRGWSLKMVYLVRGWVTQTVVVDSVRHERTNYDVVNITRLVDSIVVRGGSPSGREPVCWRSWTVLYFCGCWTLCDPRYPHIILARLRYVYLKSSSITIIRLLNNFSIITQIGEKKDKSTMWNQNICN